MEIIQNSILNLKSKNIEFNEEIAFKTLSYFKNTGKLPNEEQLEAVSGGTGYIATIVGPWIPILPTFPTGSGEDMQTIR
jgi:hypothetical protein